MDIRNVLKIHIKLTLLIYVSVILLQANLRAKTESTFLIGIQLGNYYYIVSPQLLHPKEQKILQEALILGSKTTTNLWVNLQYNSPQRFVLSPQLRGTSLSQIFLEFDIRLKETAQKIIQNELNITKSGKLRIQIQPTAVWIYKKKNASIIKNILLRVVVEGNSLSSLQKQTLQKKLEDKINQGSDFRILKTLIADIILGKLYAEFIPSSSINSEYYPYSPILLDYLEHIEKQPIGGILINFKKFKLIPLTSPPPKTISYLYPIRNLITPKKFHHNLLEYLSAFPQEGILYYLLSSPSSIRIKTTIPHNNYKIALRKTEKVIEENNYSIAQDIDSLSIPQRLIILTDFAIKHNLPIDKEIIAIAIDAWNNLLSQKEREKILPKLTNSTVVVAPSALVELQRRQEQEKISKRGISRRKFLKQLGLISFFSLCATLNAQSLLSSEGSKIDFFSLPLSKQKKLIDKLLSNQLSTKIKSTIEQQIAQAVTKISDNSLYNEITKEDLNKLDTLLKTKAIQLPSNNPNEVYMLLYTAMRFPKLRESLFKYLSSVLNSPPSYTPSLKQICLFILSEPRWFNLKWIAMASRIFEEKVIPHGISSSDLQGIGIAILESGNMIHDNYKDWQKKISKYINSLPSVVIYSAFRSVVIKNNTYTCVYNALREELIKRIKTKYNGNFLKFLEQNKLSDTLDDFVDTIVLREYHLDRFLSRLTDDLIKLATVCFNVLTKKISLPLVESLPRVENEDKWHFLSYYTVYQIRGIREIIQSKLLPKQYIIRKIKEILKNPNTSDIVKKLLILALLDTDIYPDMNLQHLSKDINAIKKILHFLDIPFYPTTNHLNCAVVFYQDAIPYLKELEKLLTSHGYKNTVHNCYQKKIGKIMVTFQLFAIRNAEMFKEIINNPSYHIIFTRHHSYSGEQFAGKGWPNILPQFIGTKNTGYGSQNNLLTLVLAEEIAKGAPHKLPWKIIQKRMAQRMTISNFIFPNDLIFKLAYALALLVNCRTYIPIPDKFHPVLIVDGGCGGINRIPQYITKYTGSIRKYTNLPQYISRLKQKLKDKKIPIVISVHGMPYWMITNIQKKFSKEEYHHAPKQEVKAGGIEIQTY